MNYEGTFDEIAEKNYQSIYNYCRVKVNDEHGAKDCTQEVFLILYKKMDKLKLSENVRAWLYRTADNVIRNYNRKNKNKNIIPLDDDEVNALSSEDEYSIERPLEDIINDDELELLNEYYINGEAIASISKKNKKTEAAILKRMQRIKMRIRNYLHENDKSNV